MNPLVTSGLGEERTTTALSVNVNKVALLRNQRTLSIPSVTRLAPRARAPGAHATTGHPRPDAPHVRRHDVIELARLMADWPRAEFNLEGNPFHNLMALVAEVRPRQCTFVPDSAEQSTSDHGWDLARDGEQLRPLIAEAQALGTRVSLFMDAEPASMALARSLGADRIELYTEPYAAAHGTPRQAASIAAFASAARAAGEVGLGVNAGHDLNLGNLAAFLAGVPRVLEVSIGHALVADALEFGMPGAVRAYLAEIERAFA